MSFIQEKLVHIDLGLSRKYILIQFNDIHAVSFNIETDNLEAIDKASKQEETWFYQRQDFARSFNEVYDQESLFTSTDCLNHLIDYSNSVHPDLVLLTGDIIDYYSHENYDFFKKSIRKIKSPYLFSCGNHESPSELFQEICGGNCDFSYVDFVDFFVVSIDNSKRKITTEQLRLLETLVKYQKPIILAMHIPIMTEYNEKEFTQLNSYYSIKYNDCDETTSIFINLISSSDEVKAIFCGHVHGTIISHITPNKFQYCCSSGLIGNVNKIIIK